MKKIFLIELKKNLSGIVFLLSVIILTVIYVTQCLPERWMYYKRPMSKEEFVYELLKEDLAKGKTKEVKGYIIIDGKQRKETIYKKSYFNEKSSAFANEILEKMKQGEKIRSYDGMELDLIKLDNMFKDNIIYTGNVTYYGNIDNFYDGEYLYQCCSGMVSIENIDELCEKMFSNLEYSLEEDIASYGAYTFDVFLIRKPYSKEELSKVAEIAERIRGILEEDYTAEIKYENILNYFDEIDEILGGDTVFGEKYRNIYFTRRYSLEEAEKKYESIVRDEKLTNAYARYYSDYMTVFAGLLPAVFGAFCLWKDERHKMREMIFSKRISSFKYIMLKFSVIAAVFLAVYSVIAGVSTVLFSNFANAEKIAVDYTAFFKYTFFWTMPTVFITTATSMFLFIIFNNPIPPLFAEVILFFLSAKDLIGNYFILKPIIRYNEVGNYDYFMEHFKEIMYNRIFNIIFSLIILYLCSIIYEARRRGFLVYGGNNKYSKKYGI